LGVHCNQEDTDAAQHFCAEHQSRELLAWLN